MCVSVAGNLSQFQRVFVPVIGNDMDVGRTVRRLRLHADEATRHVAAVKNPIHRVARKDIGDLFLCG